MGQSDFSVSGLCAHTRRDDVDGPGGEHECSTVADVVVACLSRLPGVDGAAVALMTGPDARQTVHASDGVIAAVEDLQFLQAQGPGWEAFAGGDPVLVADLHQARHRDRWPAYLPAVSALGVSAIFAFPVGAGRVPLGVLDLYRRTSGALTDEQVSIARACAIAAGYALLNTDSLTHTAAAVSGHGYRDHVHQAVGMVLVQLDVDSQEALLRLRAHSYAASRGLDDVCHDVVDRRLRFTANSMPGL
ncbi:GAF and ANTAR domain-containing protein [Actinoplanes sp. CA-015351]|uniref:GAF and ANTAR domain-containing protein n=1 Tax=Actinoplanes sp. CA-015351 TaxID=3239897 RepID=UPI003D98B465